MHNKWIHSSENNNKGNLNGNEQNMKQIMCEKDLDFKTKSYLKDKNEFKSYINISYLFNQEDIKPSVKIKIISNCIKDIERNCYDLPYETSGLLLGKIEENKDYFILEVTDGGKNEKRSWGSVTPDKNYFDKKIMNAEKRGLMYLGEWHKHPDYMTHPSGGDILAVKSIFQSCNELSDFIMIIIVKNQNGNSYDFYTYYFNRISMNPTSIELNIIKSFELDDISFRNDFKNNQLKINQKISIEELLMKKHFPTLKSRKISNGTIWEGTILEIPCKIESTIDKIRVELYDNDQNRFDIYEINQNTLPIYLMKLLINCKLKQDSIYVYIIRIIKKYNLESEYIQKYLIWLAKLHKIFLKYYIQLLIWLLKSYNSNRKLLPMYLTCLEREILLRSKTNLDKFSVLVSQFLMYNEKFQSDKFQDNKYDKDSSQWYVSRNGQEYLAKQKKMLNFLRISSHKYQFSINKKNNNLKFRGILDEIKNFILILEFPNNFLKDNNVIKIVIQREFNQYPLSKIAKSKIMGIIDLSEIYLKIYKLYNLGVNIYEF